MHSDRFLNNAESALRLFHLYFIYIYFRQYKAYSVPHLKVSFEQYRAEQIMVLILNFGRSYITDPTLQLHVIVEPPQQAVCMFALFYMQLDRYTYSCLYNSLLTVQNSY